MCAPSKAVGIERRLTVEGKNECSIWLVYVEVLVKSSSSAVEQRASNVGESDVQSPDLFARRKIPSIR